MLELEYSNDYFAAKHVALAKCEDKVLQGTIGGPCPDAAKTAPHIARAATDDRSQHARGCVNHRLAAHGHIGENQWCDS